MTSPLETTVAWEQEGERVAEALDRYSAAAVVGSDTEAAARAALGIARVQARRRRVAVADLVGEVPPLQELVPDDMPHGLVDSFLYGVSLNRIAFPVDPAENLFVLPSGAPPVDSREILGSDRWRRLAAGFREIGALLLVVVPEDADGLDSLLDVLDGVVAVGETQLDGATPVLATVVPAAEETQARAADGLVADAAPGRGADWRSLRARAVDASPTGAGLGAPKWAAPAAVLLAVTAVLLLLTWRGRAGAREDVPAAVASLADSAAPGPAATPESAAGTLSTAAVDSVADAADTSRAAPFVVVLANLNDSAIAVEKATGLVRWVPVPTVARGTDAGATWYRVTAGAYRTAAGADSLLQSLRRRKIVGAADGYVQRAPFSIRLTARPVSEAVAHGLATRLRAGGWPVFGLVQPGRRWILYIGAFETPAQAAAQMATLRSDSLAPAVAYRIGSVF